MAKYFVVFEGLKKDGKNRNKLINRMNIQVILGQRLLILLIKNIIFKKLSILSY